MAETGKDEVETFADLVLDKKIPGTTQVKLADRIGISVRTFNDLLAGRIKKAHLNTVTAIAKTLKVRPSRVRRAIAASHAERAAETA